MRCWLILNYIMSVHLDFVTSKILDHIDDYPAISI